jgi:hypothetical protein
MLSCCFYIASTKKEGYYSLTLTLLHEYKWTLFLSLRAVPVSLLSASSSGGYSVDTVSLIENSAGINVTSTDDNYIYNTSSVVVRRFILRYDCVDRIVL